MLLNMLPRVIATSSRQALSYNLDLLSRRAGVPLLVPIKANAYGHGIEQVAEVLAEHPSVWGVGVATPQEALQATPLFREHAKPVLLFGPPDVSEIDKLMRAKVHFSLTDLSELELLPDHAQVHLKVDTGMNRLGVRAEDAVELGRTLAAHGMLAGIYSHFSSADDPNTSYSHEQFQKFSEVLYALAPELIKVRAHIHMANSVGVLNYGSWLSQLSPGVTLARPGLAAYGYAPRDQELLMPVMTVEARINLLRTVYAGETVGYGRLWQAEQDTTVAVVGMGYADGWPRNVTGKASVSVAGEQRPVLGRVCMDQCMVDVTGLDVQVGDFVTMWGPYSHAGLVAQWADVSPYEILTGVGHRVERRLGP